HVGITRARRRVSIYFAANRRMHGLWSSNIPSRFLDELPEAAVEVSEARGGFAGYGNTGASRFDEMTHFGSSYGTPGWQRAQARGRFGGEGFDEDDGAYSADDYRTSSPPHAGERQGEGIRGGTRGKPRRRL